MIRYGQGPGRAVAPDLGDRELAENAGAHCGGVRVERQDRVGRRERMKVSALNRPDHVSQRRRGERARARRKMARDEVEHLSVAHERVVVRLVAEGRTSLAELLKG